MAAITRPSFEQAYAEVAAVVGGEAADVEPQPLVVGHDPDVEMPALAKNGEDQLRFGARHVRVADQQVGDLPPREAPGGQAAKGAAVDSPPER